MRATLHQLNPTVRGFDCGPGGGMHVLRLCNQLQEAADSHARELGVGAPQLMEQGLAWMLAQMELNITRIPRHGEKLRLLTWPTGANRLYAWRQYRIEAQGELLARGASAWVVVNIARHAVVRMPETLQGVLPPEDAPETMLLGPDPAKQSQPEGYELEALLPSRHSDLDRNGHVNNGVLCQWLMEPALPLAREKGLELRELAVRFKAEAAAGITAVSRLQTREQDGDLHCRHLLASSENETPLVVGSSRWTPE